MNDEQLIALVRKYAVIYDLSHPRYMDNNFRLDIWNKIGKEMKADALACKARWNNIRDNCRKSLKKTITKSGQSAKKIKIYKYSEQLSFLHKYFDEKEIKGNIDSQKDEEDKKYHEANHENEEENNQDEMEKPNILELSMDLHRQPTLSPNHRNTFEVPIKSTIRKFATKKTAPQQTATAKLIDYNINNNENDATTSSQHPVDAFLAGVAPTLKTFTPYYLNLAKSEIFATVQKYDMKMLMEQHAYQGKSHLNLIHNLTPHSEHYSTPSSSVSPPLPSPDETFEEHTTFQDQHQN